MVDIFKVIGIGLIVAAATLCGNTMAIRLQKRAAALSQMQQFCAEVGEKIRFFATPVEQIIKECAPKYNELLFLAEFPKITPQYPFDKNDDVEVGQFFAGLGASDICGQQKHCEAYSLLFGRMAEAAKEECNSKNRLYRVLGLFCGVCIAVLLI